MQCLLGHTFEKLLSLMKGNKRPKLLRLAYKLTYLSSIMKLASTQNLKSDINRLRANRSFNVSGKSSC
jgi:hypothetical protein